MIVSDYLGMLKLELSGERFNKKARNRELQARTGRKPGSIERKHQNISAILALFNQPFIWGYKPLPAYQKSLLDALQRQLAGMEVAFDKPPVDPADTALFVPAPALRPSNERLPDYLRKAIQKIDPAMRDEQMRSLGDAGESLVYEMERRRLATTRPDLLGDLEWTSKKGDGYGYDIRSFDDRGEELFLEVKTTRGNDRAPFFITRNEAEVAEAKGDQFRLRRVFQFGPNPRLFDLAPPLLEHVRLETAVYRASFS